MKNKVISIVVLFVSVFMGGAGLYAQDLVILHTNDTHSQVDPVTTGIGQGKGGVFARAEYFKKVKAENENVIILDAGDYNQGTPYFTVYDGKMEMDLMNALGYDVVALGNHEFDNGQQELAERLSTANFKTVCANYDFTGTPLEGLVEPYVILERDGLKIGIIGLILDISSVVSASAVEGLVYKDAIDVGNKYARLLKDDKKCDLVIALTHIGHSADLVLAERSRHIDIIVGGHSHTFLKSDVIVENMLGKDVVVLQAGAKGEYVGRLDIDMD